LRGESRSEQIDSLTRPIRALAYLAATSLVFFPVWTLSRWGIRGVL
jgi:hypothetical protein